MTSFILHVLTYIAIERLFKIICIAIAIQLYQYLYIFMACIENIYSYPGTVIATNINNHNNTVCNMQANKCVQIACSYDQARENRSQTAIECNYICMLCGYGYVILFQILLPIAIMGTKSSPTSMAQLILYVYVVIALSVLAINQSKHTTMLQLLPISIHNITQLARK